MTSFSKLGCALCLLFFASLASAQDFNDGELIDQTFWVKPAKEIYRRLEFYRQPKLEAATFFPPSKKQIRIISIGRGWIKLNFISAYNGFEEAYIPVGYFKRNRYTSSSLIATPLIGQLFLMTIPTSSRNAPRRNASRLAR